MSDSPSPKSILSYEEVIGLKTLSCACDKETPNERIFVPQLKYNIFYIVAAILINENGEVLLIQEAKSSCYEKWYLPAGRVESDESLVDAVKREVLEEAGLVFEPQSLICVEMKNHCWARFTFVGNVVGGKLKTLEESDSESLQAKWFSWPFVNVDLRKTDILHLIEKGQKFKRECSNLKTLPTIKQHHYYSACIIFTFKRSDELFVLNIIDSNNVPHLPSFFVNSKNSLLDSIDGIMDLYCQHGFKDLSMKLLGVSGIEHSGESSSNNDGMLFSLVVKIKGQNLPELNKNACWQNCDNSIQRNVLPLVEL